MAKRNRLPWVFRIGHRFAVFLLASRAKMNSSESSGSTGDQSSAPGDGNDESQRPDLERGDAERPSSSGPTGDKGPAFMLEPTISFFDVDLKKGHILKFRSYLSSDPLKEKEAAQDIKTVRIILKEKGEPSSDDILRALDLSRWSDKILKIAEIEEELHEKGWRHAPGYALKNLKLKKLMKMSRKPFSDRLKPLVETWVSVLEKHVWAGKMRRRFDMQSLIKLCGGYTRFQDNRLVLQANLQQSAFPPSTLSPSLKQFKFSLISPPSRIHYAYYTMSTRFWRMFAEVGFSLGRRTQGRFMAS